MKFILPMPPTLNRTYGVGNGKMYKNKTAKEWEEEAGFVILTQRKGKHLPLEGKISFGITWFYEYDRDIDAGLKILLDLFEKQSVVKNDRQFRKCEYIDIFEDVDNPRVEVLINEMA